MKKYKIRVSIVVLLTFLATLAAPAAQAEAFSLKDVLNVFAPAAQNSGESSSKGLLDILVALLLGNLINKVTDTAAAATGDAAGFGSVSDTKAGIKNNGAATKATAILNTAQKYMAVPYVWGGTTPKGWDCSGFTQYVMRENGINIPRTAEEQFNAGKKIAKSDLKAGDMVFFTTYKPQASHVGFYMGGGNFIHASSAAKKVTVSSLDEPYFKERYLGARRYY